LEKFQELRYWYLTVLIQQTASKSKRVLLKLKRNYTDENRFHYRQFPQYPRHFGCGQTIRKEYPSLGVSSTVYVVDNDRSGELKEKLQKCPQAIYVESPGNVGFAPEIISALKKLSKMGSILLF